MKKIYLLITLLLLFNAIFCQWALVDGITEHVNAIHYSNSCLYISKATGSYIGVYVKCNDTGTFTLSNYGIENATVITDIESYGDTIFCFSKINTKLKPFYSINNGLNWNLFEDTIFRSGNLLINNNYLLAFSTKDSIAYNFNYFRRYSLQNDSIVSFEIPRKQSVQFNSCEISSVYSYEGVIYLGYYLPTDIYGFLFQSSDNGNTWNLILEILPSNPPFGYGNYVSAIVKIDNNILIIGGNQYLKKSINNGTSFSLIPYFNYGNCYTLKNIEGRILLGSLNGAYISQDTATTWQSFNDGFTQTTIVYKILKVGDYLYAATDRGLWKRPFSDVVGIKQTTEKGDKSIKAYYCNNLLNINTEGLEGNFGIKIVDIQGRELHNDKMNVGKDSHNKSINLNELPAGVYIVKLFNENAVLTGKFIVK